MDSAMPVLRTIDKERGRELQRQMEERPLMYTVVPSVTWYLFGGHTLHASCPSSF